MRGNSHDVQTLNVACAAIRSTVLAWPDEPAGTVLGEAETVETVRGSAPIFRVRFDCSSR